MWGLLKRWTGRAALATALVVVGLSFLYAQTVLRGSRSAPSQASQQAPGLVCPDGYYLLDGLCYPYSWKGILTPWWAR